MTRARPCGDCGASVHVLALPPLVNILLLLLVGSVLVYAIKEARARGLFGS